MATVNGTGAADTLYGSSTSDTINGLGGNDTLKGFGGADALDGGDGIDTAFYSDSAAAVTVNLAQGRGFGASAEGDTLINIENLFGSSFNDTLTGDAGSNELNGVGGNDILKGGGGTDRLDGGTGDDTLKGGGGADVLIGGEGNDTANYGDSAAGVMVTLHGNFAAGGDADGDRLFGIENLTGSANKDQLQGDDGNNVINGGDGDDELLGSGGSDTLNGGAGNDLLEGNLHAGDGLDGVDRMLGGTGNDLYFADAGDVAIELVGQGFDQVMTFTTHVLAAGSEIEVLKPFNIFVSTNIDLVGNEFDNTIIGNAGSNTIVGSPDTDGGLYDGLDTMTGNAGGDVFVWTSTAESGVAASEADVITDFNRLEGDLIAFNQIDADVTAAGNQAFTFVGTGPFTGPGQISFFTTATDTFILLNTDTDTAQEMTIRLVGVHNVDASWFVL